MISTTIAIHPTTTRPAVADLVATRPTRSSRPSRPTGVDGLAVGSGP